MSVTVYATKDASAIINVNAGAFNAWSGWDNHMPIGLFDSGFYKGRGFVYCNIVFTGMIAITSAVLRLKQRPRTENGWHCRPSAGTSLELFVGRMKRDWGEGTNRGENVWSENESYDYNNRAIATYAGVANWTTAEQSNEVFNQSDNAWVEIDITDIVTAWFNHYKGNRSDAPNYGVVIGNENETSVGKGLDIFQRHSGTDDRAHMVVTFTSNVAPSAPVLTSPISDAIVTSSSPTLAGNADDPDSNDYITAVQVQVKSDDLATMMWDSQTINVTGNPDSFSLFYGTQPSGGSSSTVVPLIGNTFYKWRAKTRDKGSLWSPFSAYARFKLNTIPNTPSVNIVETPASDLRTNTPTVSITHSDPDPSDTKQYATQVYVERYTGTQWVFEYDTGNLTASPVTATKTFVLPALAWGTQYRVKARTKDSNASWSQFSSWFTFATHKTGTPISLDPSGDEISSSTTPNFTGARATTSDTITKYTIELRSDDFSTNPWVATEYTSGIVGGATFSKVYAGSALAAGSAYQWRAKVFSNIGGYSDWSAYQRFLTPSDPTIPTATAPIGSNSYTLTPTFAGGRATAWRHAEIQIYPATSTTANLGTPYSLSGDIDKGASNTTPYSWVYNQLALEWGTTYRYRVRVNTNGNVAYGSATWSGWSGLVSFTTDSALTPVLTSPAAGAAITDHTPDFIISAGGAETIDQMRVRLYDINNTLTWDSLLQDKTNAASATLTYGTGGGSPSPAPTLEGGIYSWEAKYQKAVAGPHSAWSGRQEFRINTPPRSPSELFPTPSHVFADTLLPYFEARYEDADFGDTPNTWEIVLMNLVGTILATKTIVDATTGLRDAELVVGVNRYTWQGADLTLAYGIDYKFKSRYKDSALEWGPYSGEVAFKLGRSPNALNVIPTEGSTVPIVNPDVTWDFSDPQGQLQEKYLIELYYVDADDAQFLRFSQTKVTVAETLTIPAGYLQNNKDYMFRLTLYNEDGLPDPSPPEITFTALLDPPDPITGLSIEIVEEKSKVILEWDAMDEKIGHTFQSYEIYKRLVGDDEWSQIDSTFDKGEGRYVDWYAGHSIIYEYRVTTITTKSSSGAELESPDDADGGNIAAAELSTDTWMFVGSNRSTSNIQRLPVTDESHERMVQQEAFETLGSDRKVIIRGFVLGNEGSITCMYTADLVASPTDEQVFFEESIIGRRLVDYITNNKGPHILKSPFGDVWEVEFAGPRYQWLPGGNLSVELGWIETGQTSKVSV